MLCNRLGELLPGRMIGSRLLSKRGPILRWAEPSFQHGNHLLGGNDDMSMVMAVVCLMVVSSCLAGVP